MTTVQTERQLANLNNSFFANFEVIYRAHPGPESTLNLGPLVKNINCEEIYVWLPHLSAVLCRISNVLHEAEKQNVMPVRYDP